MHSIRRYFIQALTLYSILLVGLFLSYRLLLEYPRELEVLAKHQQQQLQSLNKGLEMNLITLATITKDYAHWDETNELMFAPEEHANYVSKHLAPSVFDSFSLLSIGLYNLNMTPVFQQGYDLEKQLGEPVEKILDFPITDLFSHSDDVHNVQTGWLATTAGPAIFAMVPVSNTSMDAPPSGYLVFVQALTSNHLSQIQSITRLQMTLTPVLSSESVKNELTSLTTPELTEGVVVERTRFLEDYTGRPFLLMHITHELLANPVPFDRPVLIMLFLLLIIPLLIGLLVDRYLLKPIKANTAHIRKMVDKQRVRALSSGSPILELEQIRLAFNNLVNLMNKKQSELKTSQQKELEVGKAKSDFLASMSHEIRTPLTAVIGYAQSILEDDMPADKIDNAVQRIKYNGDHLLRLVNDILDVAKIEQGKIELLEEETSLFILMQEVSYTMEPLANRKGLQLCIDFQFPLPDKILIDRMRLRQILVNLIGNGIKFTETGNIRVLVSVAEPWLRFDVIDSGVGIDSLNAQKIFKSFGQASAEITRQFGGTGLGLHISKKLANLMGGDLTFSSEAKVGSTFTVMIGLKAPPSMQWTQHAEQNDLPDEKRLQQASFSGHVLLADDVEDNRLLIRSLLGRLGLTVDLAENGKEALEKALVTDYDLIFMDIQMPEMDGIQAISQLRSFGNLTTVVALTANVMKQEVKQYLSVGFNAHLGKPIDRPSLIRVLDRYLNQHQGELSELELYDQQEFLQFQQRFIHSLHERLDELKQLIIQGDMAELGNQAHAIRGSAASFEFTDIAELAMQLEKACSAGEPQFISLANKLVSQIENTPADRHE
jgi:signal transduction histidine kinase/DNA-binding NarL/FixJ family response regulator